MARFARLKFWIACDLLLVAAVLMGVQLYHQRTVKALTPRQLSEAQLDRDVSLYCDGDGFAHAIDELRAQTGAGVIVQWAPLVESPLMPETPVHVRLKHVTLRTALRALLDSTGRTRWDIGVRGNAVVIAAGDELCSAQVYDLSQLADSMVEGRLAQLRSANPQAIQFPGEYERLQFNMHLHKLAVSWIGNRCSQEIFPYRSDDSSWQCWDDLFIVDVSPDDEKKITAVLEGIRNGTVKPPTTAPSDGLREWWDGKQHPENAGMKSIDY